MKEIPLTKGYAAIVDDDDYHRLAAYSWHAWTQPGVSRVYAKTSVGGTTIAMHRFILRAGRSVVVDHINGNALDNRRSNLRITSQAKNTYNTRTVAATSGIKCVRFEHGKWRARIGYQGKLRHLGMFATAKEAAAAYDRAAKELFGEFAATNAEIGKKKADL